jgi:hypothetical protein
LFEVLEMAAAEENNAAALVDTITGATTTQVELETVETPEERAEERAEEEARAQKEDIDVAPEREEPPVKTAQRQNPEPEPG